MDVVYRLEQASVGDVLEGMDDPPSYSAVRAAMNVLVEKGHLRRRRVGRKFTYQPTVARSRARKSALKSVVDTFFAGSVESAVAGLLDLRSRDLGDEELERLARRIEEVRRRGET